MMKRRMNVRENAHSKLTEVEVVGSSPREIKSGDPSDWCPNGSRSPIMVKCTDELSCLGWFIISVSGFVNHSSALRRASVMRMLRLLGLWLILCVATGSTWAADRLPVPNDADQKTALATVKEVFRDELASAKTAADQVDLAKRMLDSLEEKPEAATANFVLLTQCQTLAMKALNIELTYTVIDELAKRYDVDALALRTSALRDMGKGPTEIKLHTSLTQSALLLVNDSIEQERFDAAMTAVDLANTLAIRTKNLDLRKQVTARKAEVVEFQKLSDAYVKAKAVLTKTPQNPAANDAAGRYLIAVKSDWDQGLKHLILSSDSTLQRAAKRDDDAIDSSKLPTADEAMALGDSWWDVANKQTSAPVKAAIKLRAGQWYGSILKNLEGLTKAKVDQRLTESRWLDDPKLEKRMPRNRVWDKLQTQFVEAEGWLQGDFAICQAASFENGLEFSKALSTRGFRPVRFRPYPTAKGMNVACIWHKEAIESQFSYGPESKIREEEAELRRLGFFPSDVAGYLNEAGGEEFCVTWTKTKPEKVTEVILMLAHPTGMPMEPRLGSGLPVAVHHSWNAKGQVVDHQIRWLPGAPHGHMWTTRTAVRAGLDRDRGLCTDISVSSRRGESDINKTFWGAVVRPLPQLRVQEVYEPEFAETRKEWAKLTADGMKPVAIGATRLEDGSIVSSTIWHGPAK